MAEENAIKCNDFVYDFSELNNRTSWSGKPWESVRSNLDLVCDDTYLGE